MKLLWGVAIASSLFLSACASDQYATDNATQNAAAVPGEKTGEGSVEPGVGPGGASANVRW